MITFEIYIDEDNNLVIRMISNNNEIVQEIYNEDAIKVFNRFIKIDNKHKFRYEKNNDDQFFYGVNNNNINIIFRNYEQTIQRIYNLKKKMLKPIYTSIIVGSAALATIGVLAYELLKKNDNYEKSKVLEGEPISFEISNDYPKEDIELLTDNSSENEKDLNTVFCDVQPKYDEKIINNVNNYLDIIKYACEKWGVSYELMINIIMQESSGGNHINKTQVKFDEWKDQVLKIFNYNENKYEKLVLTNNPEKYPNVDYKISEEEFKNPFTNISVGTAALAYIYNNYCNHNLPLSIQTYNFGYGAMQEVLSEQSLKESIPIKDIIGDETNVNFMNYTYVRSEKYGDHNYLYNVLKHSTNNYNIESGKEYTMKYIDEFGNIQIKTTRFQSSYMKENNITY